MLPPAPAGLVVPGAAGAATTGDEGAPMLLLLLVVVAAPAADVRAACSRFVAADAPFADPRSMSSPPPPDTRNPNLPTCVHCMATLVDRTTCMAHDNNVNTGRWASCTEQKDYRPTD